MKNISNYSVALRFFFNLFLACLWSLFAYSNLTAFFITGRLPYLLFVLSQTELVIFFLIRQKASRVSNSLKDSLVAFVGTFSVLLYVPNMSVYTTSTPAGYLLQVGSILIYLAVLIEILGALSLNISYGIIPAERIIKTGGLYGIVRHPIYLGSFLLYIGYIFINPSISNAIVLLVACICQIWRIENEEAFLSKSTEYEKYTERVKYKLIYGLY